MDLFILHSPNYTTYKLWVVISYKYTKQILKQVLIDDLNIKYIQQIYLQQQSHKYVENSNTIEYNTIHTKHNSGLNPKPV